MTSNNPWPLVAILLVLFIASVAIFLHKPKVFHETVPPVSKKVDGLATKQRDQPLIDIALKRYIPMFMALFASHQSTLLEEALAAGPKDGPIKHADPNLCNECQRRKMINDNNAEWRTALKEKLQP